MNVTTNKQVNQEQILLDSLDTLNRVLQYLDKWILQAMATSYLAQRHANDTNYPLFPQTVEAMVELLKDSMEDCSLISDCSSLIERINKLIENDESLENGFSYEA